MTICTSITENYLDKSKPFFESVNQYFQGNKVCFCLGFMATIEGWETIEVPLPLECNWQPKNREEFYTLQHGEFTEYYKFEDEDVILFCDSDMVLQNDFCLPWSVDDNTFLVTDSSFPATNIRDVMKNINCNHPLELTIDYSVATTDKEFCTCFLMANGATWKRLYDMVKLNYRHILNGSTHHAAWQLLINLMVNFYDFNKVTLGDFIVNASWYAGTRAKRKNGLLHVGKELVYFNHTKFNNDEPPRNRNI